MNRVIKFRGRDKSGKWHYGSLLYKQEESPVQETNAPDIETYIEGAGLNDPEIEVTLYTIGQFTGLKDSNGKEIYEGDILRISEYDNILTREFNDDPNRFNLFTLDEIKGDLRLSYTSPVTWEEGTFCISTKGDWLHHNDMFLAVLFGDMKRSSPIFIFEVIGNIHDNHELLKGGE